MAKPLQLSRMSMFLRCFKPISSLTPPPPRFSLFLSLKLKTQPFSTTSTPYPLQYDMIISRPAHPSPPPHHRRSLPKPNSIPPISESGSDPINTEPSFEDWVDQKLTSNTEIEMDKSKRKYYNKRKKRLMGSDSEDEINRKNEENELVEVKQEVVELRTLHKREEELYFHDAFAYPWEKDKHYKMVYQLEKKFYPDQGFDKAFLEPGQSNPDEKKFTKRVKKDDNKGLVFFENNVEATKQENEAKKDVSEKKVEEFFKCLKKSPNENYNSTPIEPFLSSRRTGLPPKWDSPSGTVVLINKPKGWTSFTVCGKLRRLVQVKKVGHAGTLDPMATGLLIVCVGKATKVVDSYQGMIKGYSGIFRLGEATSTLDADSPVLQRESWEHIKDDDLKKIAATFTGEIWQVPPMFSAIKVGGEKMYEKARRGESIQLSPRKISIFQFDIERSLDDRQNVIFRVICSKGTYIRSLCADFGKALSSCAHLTALKRDSIGEYLADDAWEFQELEEAITKGYM